MDYRTTIAKMFRYTAFAIIFISMLAFMYILCLSTQCIKGQCAVGTYVQITFTVVLMYAIIVVILSWLLVWLHTKYTS